VSIAIPTTNASSGSGSLWEPSRGHSHCDKKRQVGEEDRKGSVGCEALWIEERKKVSSVLRFNYPILVGLDPSIIETDVQNIKRTKNPTSTEQKRFEDLHSPGKPGPSPPALYSPPPSLPQFLLRFVPAKSTRNASSLPYSCPKSQGKLSSKS
jgi:hypothetical protein